MSINVNKEEYVNYLKIGADYNMSFYFYEENIYKLCPIVKDV
jgi:hypothetical protein